MKVLHIVGGNIDGGAARGAYWLHRGLISNGIDSRVLTNSPHTKEDSTVVTIIKNKKSKLFNSVNANIDKLPLVVYKNRKDNLFSTGIRGFDITKHPLYKWAEIINLHWINAGFIKIRHLKRIKKPIIWTMRDMWPLTGGCHVSMDCDNYKTGCGWCPQLGSSKMNDLSRFVFKRKQKYFNKSIKLVGISPWLSQRAKESGLFHDFEIKTIFNNVSCEDFFPIEKKRAREVLGVNTNKKIILIGATHTKAYYKGFEQFLQATKTLNPQEYFIVLFGRLDDEVAQKIGFEHKNLGLLNDYISLRLAYSSADVFVAPSLMDAFGKTLAESMACGTPVVCFNATGPGYIVDHKVNGYKARPFEPLDLCRGIEWVANNPNKNELNIQARQKALHAFDVDVIAKQYINLYQSHL